MKHSLLRKTMKKMMVEHKLLTLGLFAVIFGVIVLSLIPPQLLKLIIDENLVLQKTDRLFSRAVLYLIILIVSGCCDFLKGALLAVFGQKMMTSLRIDLNDKLRHINSTYYTSHSAGEISSRIMNDVANVNSLFTDGAISMMIDCLKILGILISVFFFSLRLGIMVLIMIPLIFLLTRAFQKRMLKAQVSNLTQLGLVNGHISDTLKNIRMIKSYSKEEYMEQLYDLRIEENFKTVDKVNFYDSIYSPIIQVIRAILIVVLVMLVSNQGNILGISLGMVAATIEYISNLFSPIEALGMELQSIQKGISGAKRINDFDQTTEGPKKDFTLTAERILASAKETGLFFDGMSFSYEESSPVIDELTIKIPYGSSVTFMGRTGVGKTTLFRLIMGLLTPTKGDIFLGKFKVSDIPSEEKRKIFGYVEQQFQLIDGTLGEQISLKDPSITKEQIQSVLSFVGLSEYVKEQELGLDTVIKSSTAFSQGQLQLLSIARAIVANPAILLLDEITANLDSATEAHIVSVLQKAQKGRTVLSISHRKTAILNYDQVIYLGKE